MLQLFCLSPCSCLKWLIICFYELWIICCYSCWSCVLVLFSLDNVSLTQYQGIDCLCLFCVAFSVEKKNMLSNKWYQQVVKDSSCWFFFICAFNAGYYFLETKDFEMSMMGECNYLLEFSRNRSSSILTTSHCQAVRLRFELLYLTFVYGIPSLPCIASGLCQVLRL